jgi:hypothetical protein
MTFPLLSRDRNARDLLGHIAAWHQMLIRWYSKELEGVPTPVPCAGYSWDEVAEMNQAIWRVVQDMTYDAARSAAVLTHHHALKLYDGSTDTQLWTPGLYDWTRGSAVGSWFETATSIHYQWASAKIRRAIRLDAAGHEPGERDS